MAQMMVRQFPRDVFPHLYEFTIGHVLKPGYEYGAEFDFGLELILDGLESARMWADRSPGALGPHLGEKCSAG